MRASSWAAPQLSVLTAKSRHEPPCLCLCLCLCPSSSSSASSESLSTRSRPSGSLRLNQPLHRTSTCVQRSLSDLPVVRNNPPRTFLHGGTRAGGLRQVLRRLFRSRRITYGLELCPVWEGAAGIFTLINDSYGLLATNLVPHFCATRAQAPDTIHLHPLARPSSS